MANKEELINVLLDYEMDIMDQRDLVVRMRYHLDMDMEDAAEKAAKEFSKTNEELYLKLKSLIYMIQKRPSGNMAEAVGTTDSFPSELKKTADGVWKFTLPPFYSVSAKKKLYNEGKHMYYLVLNLLMQYEDANGRVPALKKPCIIFRHHICTKIQQPFDYDNIDSKRAVDAMQGYFIQDDNALQLEIHQEAVEDPETSFCEIFVIDQAETGPVLSPKITGFFD